MLKKLLGLVFLGAILSPISTLAATSTLDGLIHIPPPNLPSFPTNKVTCSVEGTISRPNSISNKVTYKVHYDSNYSLMNAQYTVYGNFPQLAANLFVYQSAGATSFSKGSDYISIQGNKENSFTYLIKDNPSITVRASLAGVQCTPKTFRTLPAPVLAAQPTLDLTDVTLNTTSLRVTSSVPLNIPVEQHACKMLIEAASIDSDSILIGGAISVTNLKTGQYNYTVRGYRSDTPNNVTKYTGVYNAKLDTASALVFGQDGKAFLFTYDSKASTDSYIVSATLGNVDCSAVIFPSQRAAAPLARDPNNEVIVQSPDASTSSPAVSENTNSSNINGVAVVGLSDEELQQGETLGLLSRTGDVQAQAVVQEKIEKETGFLPATGAIESKDDAPWTSRDYTIAGLLGAIFVALVSYIVMKYRGMM